MYAPLISDEDDTFFEELRVSLMNYSNLPGAEEDSTVIRDVKLTYPLQRKYINRARTSTDWRQVFASWPLLRKQSLFLAHANFLVGKDTLQLWLQEMSGLKTLHAFMASESMYQKAHSTKGNSDVIDHYLEESRMAQESSQSRKPLAIGVFPLIVAYFKEKEHHLFLIVSVSVSKTTSIL